MTVPDLRNDVRRQISLDPPRFRGLLHLWCVPLAVVAGVWAMIRADGALFMTFCLVYGIGLTLMFLISSSFHRGKWTDEQWWRMRQLDHTGIYLVIACTFTGIGGTGLEGTSRLVLLSVVWAVTVLGIGLRWSPVVPPFGLMTMLYVVLVAIIIPFLGQLHDRLGSSGMWLLLGGCGVYLVGAIGLGLRRPDPWPTVFGYHEIWHVLVTVASIIHFVVLMRFALPQGELA